MCPICPYLGSPVPKEVTSPTPAILHQLRFTPSSPAGPSQQRGQGAAALQQSLRDTSSRSQGEQTAAQISSASKQQPAQASHSRSQMLAWQLCHGTLLRLRFMGCMCHQGPAQLRPAPGEKSDSCRLRWESSRRNPQFWNAASKPALQVSYTFV